LDDHLSPSYRFDATNDLRKVADDLLAFRTCNKLEKRRNIEFARDIAIDDRDSPFANWAFAVTLERSDPDDPTGVWKGVAVP